MPQSTRRWISEQVKALQESDVLPFHELLDAEMVNSALASAGITFKERIYTPFVTLSVFLSQVLPRQESSACCCILTRRASEGNAPDPSLPRRVGI